MNTTSFFRLVAVGGALAALLPAFAQLPRTQIVEEIDRDATSPDVDVTVVIGDRESAAHAGEAFKDNAPVNPNDAGLPRFAIIGHENLFYLGIGLQFQGEAVFDWGDEMPSAINMIPNTLTPRTPGNGSSLRFSAATSSVYLSCVALPNNKNKVGLFFSANFSNDYNFNLSHFYIRYRGLTAGYTNSAFTDGAVIPITVDNQGPNGVINYTSVGGYWRQRFNKHWSGAIGVDAPSASMTYSTTTSEVSQRIPAFPVYLQYRWGKGNHLRASALMRPMQYRNLDDAKNVTPFGWGVQLSGISKIAGGLSAVFAGSYGKGIGQYFNGDNGLNYDAVAVAGKPGKLDLVRSMGLMGGLVYNISTKLSSNVVYSHLSNWLEKGSVTPEANYRYGDYVAANVIYAVNRIVSVGLEYDYAKKKTWTGDNLHSNRVQCQLAVTF